MSHHASVLLEFWQWSLQNLVDSVNVSKWSEAAKILFLKVLH